MAKADVAVPVNARLLSRRESSLTNHINRIRSAKYLQTGQWVMPADKKIQLTTKNFPIPKLTKSGKYHKAYPCCPAHSSEDLDEAKKCKAMQQRTFYDIQHISNENKLSSDSLKEENLEKPQTEISPSRTPRNLDRSHKVKAKQGEGHLRKSQSGTLSGREQSSSENVNKSDKIEAKKVKGNPKKYPREISAKNPSKNVVKSSSIQIKTKQTSASNIKKRPKTKKKRKIKSDKSEEDSLNEDGMDYDNDSEIIPVDKSKLLNTKDRLPSRDTIILQWLHSLKCSHDDKSDSPEANRLPVRILKKPLSSSDRQKSKAPPRKKSSVNFEKAPNFNDKTNKKVSKTDIKRNPAKTPNRNASSLNNLDELPKQYPETETSKNASDGNVATDLKKAQIYVSELGKIQITLDPKTLSPEDAAIVIWLDDLPETALSPDLRKCLSISSLKGLKPSETSGNVSKSHSAPALEDISSQRPIIIFPQVTVIKNIALGSKAELQNLNNDDFNSIYYKRCNLNHIPYE